MNEHEKTEEQKNLELDAEFWRAQNNSNFELSSSRMNAVRVAIALENTHETASFSLSDILILADYLRTGKHPYQPSHFDEEY